MKPELSLVIPFFNEEENIEKVSAGISNVLDDAGISYELILVDNGSSDRTNELIRTRCADDPRCKLVEVKVNCGYGNGVLAGLRHASGDILGFTVGDGQSSPTAVIKVFEKLEAEGLDLCKARREIRHDGSTRAAVSKWGNRVFHWAFPVLGTTDINGTPKLFTSLLYQKVDPKSTDWFLDAEIVIKAHWLGARVGEADVESPPREAGSSNVRWTTLVEFLRNVARFRWGREIRDWRARSI